MGGPFHPIQNRGGDGRVFDAPFIRIFSYYGPSESDDISNYRDEVIRRMREKVDYIKNRNIVLVHENEKGIYARTSKGCLDLLKTIDSPKFRAAFDAANMVQEKETALWMRGRR